MINVCSSQRTGWISTYTDISIYSCLIHIGVEELHIPLMQIAKGCPFKT